MWNRMIYNDFSILGFCGVTRHIIKDEILQKRSNLAKCNR